MISNKKILIPGMEINQLKAINKLFLPSYFLIPMCFCCLIAQISDNLKGVLNVKEIQQLYSVKVYSRILCLGKSSLSLSYLYSIIKTLGYELETLSVLPIKERINFLSSLLKVLLEGKGVCKVNNSSRLLSNPFKLMQHRRGLALQLRSLLVSLPLFSSHSITVGLNVKDLTLSLILDSCKDIWFNLGLENEEFDFLLRKEALSKVILLDSSDLMLFSIKSQFDYIRILLYFELKSFFYFNKVIDFSNDDIVLKSPLNLTALELELGFIQRELPEFPKKDIVLSSDYQDDIIRTSLSQRRSIIFSRKF